MKKYLLSALAVAAVAFMGSAQETKPAPGVLNMEEDSAGLGNIEVTGTYEINRECTAMAQLYQNGVLLRQVPAYQGSLVYVFEGFDTSNQNPLLTQGSLHITFYTDQLNPANQFGSYKVIIPEGFTYEYVDGEKQPSPRLEREFFINVPSLSFFPTRGSNVEKLQTVYVTLPELATNVKISGGAVVELMNDDSTTYSSISSKVTGRIVEYTFPEIGGFDGRAEIRIPAGTISFDVVDGPLAGTYSNNGLYDSAFVYMVSNADKGESLITPAPGVFDEPIVSKMDITQDVTTGNMYTYFFQMTAPESMSSVYMVSKGAQAELYKLNSDGSRDAVVAKFGMQKIHANVIGFYSSDVDLWRVPSEFYPGAGKYELVIPAGKIFWTMTTKNDEISFGPYEFKALAGDEENFIVTPSTTSEIDYLKDIEITFPEGSELTWNVTNVATLSNQYTTVYLKPSNLTNEFAGVGWKKIEGNTVKFELPVELKYAGEWTLEVGGNTLRAAGQNILVTKTFNIKTPEAPALEITPSIANASVTSQFDEDYGMDVYYCAAHTLDDEVSFTFDIPNGFTNMYYISYASMQNDLPSYRRIPVSDAIAAGMKEGNTITIENGDVNLAYEVCFAIGEDIPEDARYLVMFTVDDNTEVTGVELIKANELVDVYSVTGARVASKVDARILQQLPAGLYIINGKKVLVK